ncbi:MAG: hypothetical protein ACRD2S_05945 [Terriglobales bacterium]
MRALFSTLFVGIVAIIPAMAAEVHPPPQVMAGASFSMSSSGSGHGTLYLVGPAHLSKWQVNLGADIEVDGDEVEHAGRYTAILCTDQCSAAEFYVHPAGPDRLSLLVHPSRVPVSNPNAISAVAVVWDVYHNLELSSQTVKFTVNPDEHTSLSEARTTNNGIAWIRLTSGQKSGVTKLEASVAKVSEVRVVQQVASDACNLRIRASAASKNIMIETDPVRDCSGNFVPDGTVVSFTMTDSGGKNTVDVPIKRGIAKVEMPAHGRARITAASGVVTGNELDLAGGGE